MRVGVLALAGTFREHGRALEELGARVALVHRPVDLRGCRALVIPGGDSAVIGELMLQSGLWEPVRRLGAGGLPVFGTGAGMVLLARYVEDSEQPRLGLMNVGVSLGIPGHRPEDFAGPTAVPVLGPRPFNSVFSRAPVVVAAGPGTEVLGQYHDRVVLVRQAHLLGAVFQPELSGDSRLHTYFLNLAR